MPPTFRQYGPPKWNPSGTPRLELTRQSLRNYLETLVGAAGFEPTTPSPPDWCANQAAPRSDTVFLRAYTSGARNIAATPFASKPIGEKPQFARFAAPARAQPATGLSGP